MAATTTTNGDIKKAVPGNVISYTVRNENYMVLSTTYALNNSDTKRIQVGLRVVSDKGEFEATIKLSGNGDTDVYFNEDTWNKFQNNMEIMGSYLRGLIKNSPDPITINNIIVRFTTAYGTRAITVSYKDKTDEEEEGVDNNNEPTSNFAHTSQPPAKKRKIFVTNIVMQKVTFEGIENIEKCINARFGHLNLIVNHVNECMRFLIIEIKLNLSKHSLNENVIRQTLCEKYSDIEKAVSRQITNINFSDGFFSIS